MWTCDTARGPRSWRGASWSAQLPADLTSWDLTKAILGNVDMRKCKGPLKLVGCDVAGAQPPEDLAGWQFTDVNLSYTNMQHPLYMHHFKGPVVFRNCKLPWQAKLPTDLSGWEFHNVKLY